MSTAILLSSSPPRTFARSPTAADSSPYLPSPSELFKHGSQIPKRFKTTSAQRDSFSSRFGNGRTLLGVKFGTENISLGARSSSKDTFKLPTISSQDPRPNFASQTTAKGSANASKNPELPALHKISYNQDVSYSRSAEEPGPKAPVLSFDGTFADPFISPGPQRALSRRNDWTPLKEDPVESALSQDDMRDPPTSFPKDLLASFGFEETLEHEKKAKPVRKTENPQKRRKIELVETKPLRPNPLTEATKKIKTQTKPPSVKRTRSPAKKPLTITALATSRYFGKEDTSKGSPMMQHLSSTQARDMSLIDEDMIEVLSREPRERSQKKPATKKSQSSKSRLVSPRSAMLSLEAQETTFGSASQLLHGEPVSAPAVLSSDPISPERTQAISIASTSPRTGQGTSKFVKTRNLWAAAGRDEDNALLHVETIDLFDTPCMRDAFAGKDALVAPAPTDGREQRTESRTSAVRFQVDIHRSATRRPSVFDIDEIPSPSIHAGAQKIAARPIHTTTKTSTAKEKSVATKKAAAQQPSRKRVSAVATKTLKANIPPKPSYVGFETSALQKQIMAYGFKPIKKREKMIELLDRCWNENYLQKEDSEAEDSALKHGDFLIKVHDISNRPEPKLKKSRKRTKAQTEAKDGASPVKATKRRKEVDSKAEEGKDLKAKKPRKSRSKKSALPDEIIDIDDDGSESRTAGLQEAKVVKTVNDSEVPAPVRAPLLVGNIIASGQVNSPAPVAALADLGEQIHAAILRQSKDAQASGRDHVGSPTWHEKILMYDPIILEDLTVWLNTEGLGKIHEDREVSALDVRTWCESKGVCCLWKGGWRGNKAMKAGED